jgi:hypothetical protein
LTSTANAFDNNWHLVGFSFNAGALKLYVDTVAVSSTVATTTIYNSDGDLAVGCNFSSAVPSEYFSGMIDEARLYNEAIPTSQIKELYYSGLNNLFFSEKMEGQDYLQRVETLAIVNE